MTQARLGPEVKWAWSMRFAMGAAASDGDPVPSEGDMGRADDVVDDTPGGGDTDQREGGVEAAMEVAPAVGHGVPVPHVPRINRAAFVLAEGDMVRRKRFASIAKTARVADGGSPAASNLDRPRPGSASLGEGTGASSTGDPKSADPRGDTNNTGAKSWEGGGADSSMRNPRGLTLEEVADDWGLLRGLVVEVPSSGEGSEDEDDAGEAERQVGQNKERIIAAQPMRWNDRWQIVGGCARLVPVKSALRSPGVPRQAKRVRFDQEIVTSVVTIESFKGQDLWWRARGKGRDGDA